ncbi:response regulator transcription factor [Metabacillus sp. RGM 3146]|uniref:response regulator transcription factor n=1 Tax=Metabacillus sp. RGM 3146 TaxID=3401092 RepID=UPI003B99F91E
MKILLAEDDHRLAKLMIAMLKKQFYTVDWVEEGNTAYDYGASGSFDVIILDWMLPGKTGIEVSKLLRQEGFQGAIILLTARDTTKDRIEGLDAGADDYIAKPFEFEELFARLRALLRRNFYPLEQNTLTYDDLTIDLNNHQVYKDREPLNLTAREFQLLTFFARHPGQTLTKDTILDRVWDESSEVTANTLEAYIKLLRQKLDSADKQKYIRTIRGAGYQWVKKDV